MNCVQFAGRKQDRILWQLDPGNRDKVLGYCHKSHVLESLLGSYVILRRKATRTHLEHVQMGLFDTDSQTWIQDC